MKHLIFLTALFVAGCATTANPPQLTDAISIDKDRRQYAQAAERLRDIEEANRFEEIMAQRGFF